MNLTSDDEKRHLSQMKIQSPTAIHLHKDAKAKHGVYPRWHSERRLKDNQGEITQCLEDRSNPLVEVTSYENRAAKCCQRGLLGTISHNKPDSVPLAGNFTPLPNINKLQGQTTSFNKSIHCHSIPFHPSSNSKHSTVITSKARSDHHHHHTPIAPYRRLPLSYRQSAKRIVRKSNRLFDDSLYSNQISPQQQLISAQGNPAQDHHQKQEDQSDSNIIQSEKMNNFNPLCAEIAHLPTIESADEANSPPSTPLTTSSGHHRQSSTFSGRRSSTALSTHADSYRSLKGKGSKSKGSSAWDEEEKQKKSPSKTLSKWKNLGATNRVEKKKVKNDIVLTPKSILNKSVSSIDLSSKEDRGSPVVSPREQGELLRKSGSLSPLNIRTSEPDFFSSSFGNVLQSNASVKSLTSSLTNGVNPSFEIQTRHKEHFPNRSSSMQEGDKAPSDYSWMHGATPPSPRYPQSISSSKKISSTPRGQARVTSGDSSIGSSTIQSVPSSPTQEILWDSKRKMRYQTNSTFSSVSTFSNNSGADFGTSTDNALLQGLQSPIGSLDISSPPSNNKRVSKNIGVQNIRKTATKLQEALRESEEIEEEEEEKETGYNANGTELAYAKSQSSHTSSITASSPSSMVTPPTPTWNNSMPITLEKLQIENSTSSIDTTREHVADDDRPKEKREMAYSPRGEDLEAYNKFLTELQQDFGTADDQEDADTTITAIKQVPILKKARRHRSSTTNKDQLFTTSEKTQIAKPRRSCASLTVDQPIATSSKTSLSSYSDSDEIATNEYDPSQECSSETGSSIVGGIRQRNGYQDGETEDTSATHDEEILQSSVDSSMSYATIDQTTDAQMEILDCRIQSVRRFDMTASVPPSPRMIRCDSQQSLLSQAKAISKEEEDQKRDSLPSISHRTSRTPSETSFNQFGTQPIFARDCRLQSVDVKTGSSEANMAVTLNWTSMIDSSALNTSRPSHIVHGKLQLEESEVERIARAWIDTQLGQMGREQALSSSEGLRRASEKLSLGLTEEEIRKVNQSVLEQRQREILASAYASTLHNRDQIREKMTSERLRNTSTTSSDDSCKQRRRSLHLKPDQLPSPGLFIDTESATLSESILSKGLTSSPSRFHPLISPVSATSSARQSFNSIASYKRLSPKKLRE
ncbi:uncharacterized protein FA14DRAFT_174001 [Meira miltonrushii]|uniref:Uncharacterized protein n=1 Tax=Meira miltonrushii TaxID=1280837 RepID=A0A316VFP9_9BASI|nr:uncharacterized protein FA14DRAFT_174001 [Meira miltonrushii]PWN34305.1 hypothetical protein FA14DRAFT_174001 [Meira miltonrushii]